MRRVFDEIFFIQKKLPQKIAANENSALPILYSSTKENVARVKHLRIYKNSSCIVSPGEKKNDGEQKYLKE